MATNIQIIKLSQICQYNDSQLTKVVEEAAETSSLHIHSHRRTLPIKVMCSYWGARNVFLDWFLQIFKSRSYISGESSNLFVVLTPEESKENFFFSLVHRHAKSFPCICLCRLCSSQTRDLICFACPRPRNYKSQIVTDKTLSKLGLEVGYSINSAAQSDFCDWRAFLRRAVTLYCFRNVTYIHAYWGVQLYCTSYGTSE
jgi:hypothetical protein